MNNQNQNNNQQNNQNNSQNKNQQNSQNRQNNNSQNQNNNHPNGAAVCRLRRRFLAPGSNRGEIHICVRGRGGFQHGWERLLDLVAQAGEHHGIELA